MIQGKSHHAESCAKTRKSSVAQNRIQGKTTTAEDNRQSFAPSVTTAALLNRNTSGRRTHTPQLTALRLDNPSLQKASRHE